MLVKYVRFLIKNYLFALIALAFAGAYWISAKDLPEKATDFPRALFLVLIPLFIWNGVNSVKEFRATLSDTEEEGPGKWDCSLNITKQKVVVTAFTLVYIVLISHVGFFICTIAYLAALSFYLGIRRPAAIVLFSVLFTVAIYGIFVLWLQIRMPAGILF